MRYVAFLRAINVGGHIVKMDRLRLLFEALDLQNVTTFIASGNVIFDDSRRASSLERAIEKTLNAALGYPVTTMVRTPADLARILASARRMTASAPGALYVGLLKGSPTPSASRAVARLSTETDRLAVEGRELYWCCTTSFSESAVTGTRLEKLLGVPATLRNVNTIARIADKYAQS